MFLVITKIPIFTVFFTEMKGGKKYQPQGIFILQIEFGIVYSCVEDKMYTARKGKGAFCNGQKLQVSGQQGKWNKVVCLFLNNNSIYFGNVVSTLLDLC